MTTPSDGGVRSGVAAGQHDLDDSSPRNRPSTERVNGHAAQRKLPSVSLVIPAINEAKNISWVMLRVPAWVAEVILVDGNPNDGTADVARAIRPDVRVVEDPGGGKGAALRAGFAAATGDFIVMIDADGSMDPQEIGRFAAALSSDFDLVKGSRFMSGGGSTDITLLRRAGNAGLRVLLNRLYGAHLTDLCYGYCAFRRDRLADLNLVSDGFEIETEIAVNALHRGFRICEVPSDESPRGHGASKLHTFRDGSRVVRLLIASWISPTGRRPASRPAQVVRAEPDSEHHRLRAVSSA